MKSNSLNLQRQTPFLQIPDMNARKHLLGEVQFTSGFPEDHQMPAHNKQKQVSPIP